MKAGVIRHEELGPTGQFLDMLSEEGNVQELRRAN